MGKTAAGALALVVAMGSTGCIIKAGDDDDGGGGGGSGGSPPDDGCEGVPVTGECVDDKTIRSCFVSEQSGEPPQIIEATCGDHEVCGMGVNGAECQLEGDCRPGDTRCKDASTLQTCVDGSWSDTPCGTESCLAQPGFGAQCLSNEGSTGLSLRGKLEYEYLVPNSQLTDFDATPKSEPAVDFFVTVIDTSKADPDEQLLGMALTSFGNGGLEPGEFEVPLDAPVNEDTFIYFWPILFDNSGQPRMGLAKAESDDAIHQKSSDGYWWWGFETCAEGTGECGVEDLGTLTITTDDDSGAAHIYQWMDFGIFRFAELFPSVQPLTFAVFWKPGTAFNCGNCFVPPVGGGSTVVYDPEQNLADHFDSTINISGSSGTPTQWSRSVINHELGHWSMQSYTKSPGEGGVHYVDAASRPGLAYSEGYATFAGQTQISNSPSDNDPIYFTKKKGTSFWVDLSKNSWSQGSLETPDPNGPLDQWVNENVIAGMFWSLWAQNNAVTPQGLGEGPLFDPLRSPRLLNNATYNRGYGTVDFVDYLDAMKCGGHATSAQIGAVTADSGYPWDDNPTCP